MTLNSLEQINAAIYILMILLIETFTQVYSIRKASSAE